MTIQPGATATCMAAPLPRAGESTDSFMTYQPGDNRTDSFTVSAIIATRDRAEQLAECLASLAAQSRVPEEVIIVDVSAGDATRELIAHLVEEDGLSLTYMRGEAKNPGVQRNQGARAAVGDILLFLDDDVVLEEAFLAEILAVFAADPGGEVAGVGGTIVNQVFQPLSPINTWIHRVFFDAGGAPLAGRVIGPAINFLPADHPDLVQPVEWLNTTGTAYRHVIFRQYQFSDRVQYPFDDLYLSTRIGRDYQLRSTTRARYVHKDLGGVRARDWAEFGYHTLRDRHAIMTEVLQRTDVVDFARLLLFDLVYQPLALLRQSRFGQARQVVAIIRGRLRGCLELARTRSPMRWLLAAPVVVLALVVALLAAASARLRRRQA